MTVKHCRHLYFLVVVPYKTLYLVLSYHSAFELSSSDCGNHQQLLHCMCKTNIRQLKFMVSIHLRVNLRIVLFWSSLIKPLYYIC